MLLVFATPTSVQSEDTTISSMAALAPSPAASDLVELPADQCEPSLWGCYYDEIPDGTDQCGLYNDAYADVEGWDWLFAVSFIVMCFMAFGIGANDSANSWGTSVGAGAISVVGACIIGGAMEWIGAITLGFGVSGTIQKGVAAPDDPACWACGYCNSEISVYAIGMFASLLSAGIFLMIATFTAMPVSTTHAIIGAVVGATVVGTNFGCLNWAFNGGLGGIIASWVISPLASGAIATVVYLLTEWPIMRRKLPTVALYAMPVILGLTAWIMIFLILIKSKATKHLGFGHQAAYACAGLGAFWIVGQVIIFPLMRKRLPSVVKEHGWPDDWYAKLIRGLSQVQKRMCFFCTQTSAPEDVEDKAVQMTSMSGESPEVNRHSLGHSLGHSLSASGSGGNAVAQSLRSWQDINATEPVMQGPDGKNKVGCKKHRNPRPHIQGMLIR